MLLIAWPSSLATESTMIFPHAAPAADVHPLPPITLAEKAGALLLLGATVYVGLKPDVLLDWIVPALQSPAFQAVMKGVQP